MAASFFEQLPQELLLLVASHLSSTGEINSLARTNRHFFERLELEMYNYDVLTADDGCSKALGRTLLSASLDGEEKTRIARKAVAAGADVRFYFDACVWFDRKVEANGSNIRYYKTKRKEYWITAVGAAAASNSVSLLQVFLDADANIVVPASGDISPLQHAVIRGGIDTVQLLLRQGELNLVDKRLLFEAMEYDHSEIAELLVPHYKDPSPPWGKSNLLRLAILGNRAEMVSLLLRSYPDLDRNLIRLNSKMKCLSLRMSPSTACLTPFSLACRRGSLSIVRMLHDDDGVDVDKDCYGRYSPAEMALLRSDDDKEVIRFLIRSKKARSVRKYAFHWACQHDDFDLALEIIMVAEDHDRKDAPEWIKAAYGHNWIALVDLIREK